MNIVVIGPIAELFLESLTNMLIHNNLGQKTIDIDIVSFADEKNISLIETNDRYFQFSTIYKMLYKKKEDFVTLSYHNIKLNDNEEKYIYFQNENEAILMSFFENKTPDKYSDKPAYAKKYKILLDKIESKVFSKTKNSEIQYIVFQPFESSFSISQLVKFLIEDIKKETIIYIDLSYIIDPDNMISLEKYLHSIVHNKNITLFTYANTLPIRQSQQNTSTLALISLFDYIYNINQKSYHYTYTGLKKNIQLDDLPYLKKSLFSFLFFIYFFFYIAEYNKKLIRSYISINDPFYLRDINYTNLEFAYLIHWIEWLDRFQSKEKTNTQFVLFDLNILFKDVINTANGRVLIINPMSRVGDIFLLKEKKNQKLKKMFLFKFLSKSILLQRKNNYIPSSFYTNYQYFHQAVDDLLTKT